MPSQYLIPNGPMPTTASQAMVTSGTAIKTMLQLKPFNTGKIMGWGVHAGAAASLATIQCELIDTGTVFGTVTASADVDCTKFGSVEDAVASIAGLTLGTAATGYTCTSEGSITAVRLFDLCVLTPSAGAGDKYSWDFPLGREPKFIIGNALRIRVKADVAASLYAWIRVEI